MDESNNEKFSQEHATPRNENLTGGKSTKAHSAEASTEKELAEHGKQALAGRLPDEVKATENILPEDAEAKAARSEESE